MSPSTMQPTPYIPNSGLTVVGAAPATPPRIDLSLNESAFGVSPLAVAAAQTRAERLHRYPDPASTALRAAIGKAFDLDPDRLVCGNGSEEILDLVGRLYARPGDEILFADYGFLQFPIVAARVGATPVTAPMRDLRVDVDALLAGVTPRTKIVFLDNPNNPCGRYVSAAEVERLRDGLPADVVLVIDSAYADFVDASDYTAGHEFVADHENVIVTRTFSKAWSLAALRVGWGHCAPSMAATINRMRAIGNINALAQAAAVAALEDPGFVKRVAGDTTVERERLCAALAGLGLETVPSVTNFVMVRFPQTGNHRAGVAKAHLADHGIRVRGVDDYGLDDHLRITIGLPADNDAVIAALRGFMV